ncbi:hypothetical protein ATO12_17140 [Aquimarina atlantica]|uniref:Uncharacterized protein n=1 Tax=Aquimarina atlantica TaxID=1317122 RepID=A0A023BUI0_9FLAO|nr:hypothetical protein [Aquimarina atlantica]EZH73661.1 hypothetical protein ATO12_17140 [Aquimarina atlantica]
MWAINEKFVDYSHPQEKDSVFLNPNQTMNPQVIEYPIIWKGFVGSEEVEIIQKGQGAHLDLHFIFKKFPERYNHIKPDIINWIHKYLRILN